MRDQKTIDLVTQCRDALAEELGAWDIDPPLHHVKAAHDKCVAWLDDHTQQAEPVVEPDEDDLPDRLLQIHRTAASEAVAKFAKWQAEQAEPVQAEPVVDRAQCDGGACGVGGYCDECPKRQAEPVATEKSMDIELTDEDLVLLSDALQAQIHAFGTEAAQTAHEEDQGALIRHAQALEALKDKLDTCVAGTYAVISRVRILF
jgi:hypothetical protein